MKGVQYFSDEYLEYCRSLSSTQIIQFLEDFRRLQQKPSRSKLISIKIPENMLAAFKHRCRMQGTPYQTQIKKIMQEWLLAAGE